MMKKIIIDVDTGVDDAMAIMYAIAQPDCQTLAITCVNGNTTVDKACINTLRVLELSNKLNIPVYSGAHREFIPRNKSEIRPSIHGEDGLGGATWDTSVDTSVIQSEHAVNAMIRLVKEYPGEITFVTLAPLTNIALALQLDRSFGENLKEMMIMGGNFQGKGNVTISAEFNFYVDPEAAHMVLQDVTCPVTMVTWETCLTSLLSWEILDELFSLKTTKAEFFRKITTKFTNTLKERNIHGFMSCDLFAMMVLFNESVCLEFQELNATVELQGKLTRGQMVIDWTGRWSKKPNVRIAMKLDKEKIIQYMRQLLK